MFYVQDLSIYMNFGGYGGNMHIPPYIFCILLKKKQKKYKGMTYSKITFYIILILNFFSLDG